MCWKGRRIKLCLDRLELVCPLGWTWIMHYRNAATELDCLQNNVETDSLSCEPYQADWYSKLFMKYHNVIPVRFELYLYSFKIFYVNNSVTFLYCFVFQCPPNKEKSSEKTSPRGTIGDHDWRVGHDGWSHHPHLWHAGPTDRGWVSMIIKSMLVKWVQSVRQ